MRTADGTEGTAARATVKLLADHHGRKGYESVMQWSSERRHPTFPDGPSMTQVLEERGMLFDNVLEIGTARGMSAVILSHWAKKIYTIDIYKSEWIPQIFNEAGMTDRVKQIIVKDNDEKEQVIRDLDFEMAYIDGSHVRPQVQIDFDLTKRCGLMLFHDYPRAFGDRDGPGWVLDHQNEGEVIDRRPFAWWEVTGK